MSKITRNLVITDSIIEESGARSDTKILNVNMSTGSFLFAYEQEGTTTLGQHRCMGSMRVSDAHSIVQDYVEIAEDLRKEYIQYLNHIVPEKIMFLVDETWALTEKTSSNSRWKADMGRLSGMVKALTGFEYVIKLRRYWIDKWDDAQLNASIMSQLLRISSEDGAILKYNEDFNSNMVSTFGKDYLDPEVTIKNLLIERIDIKVYSEANGQISLEEAERRSISTTATAEEKPKGKRGRPSKKVVDMQGSPLDEEDEDEDEGII